MDDLISRQAAIDAVNRLSLGETDAVRLSMRIADYLNRMPSAQPTFDARDTQYNLPTGTDCISRQAAIEALDELCDRECEYSKKQRSVMCGACHLGSAFDAIEQLPSAQPEIIRCKDCIYYDPSHVENNGVRYEYDEMPADAFDALGTGLVNAEYGINIGGRCCVDYYCKNYSDDKRVFVREDNYCGRAERRTDE